MKPQTWPVYVLKKALYPPGAAGKKLTVQPVRIKDKSRKTIWIPIDEIIISAPKNPISKKQRKVKYGGLIKKEARAGFS